MSYCYLCGHAIKLEDKSDEHIIPNALGGRLKSDRVLCEKHNNELGTSNDAKFVSIFSHISKLTPIKAERKVSNSFVGIHVLTGISVTITGNKITPSYLSFNEEDLVLYAPNKKMVENYKKKLQKDGYNLKDITIITEFDRDDVEIYSGFDNEIFKLGFAKIAANFATEKGIDSKY
ncbi:HNH endonuclease, partial [Photobacterium chitinilyticum]|uniref:HNH endonuclease n=1 Tax=Photobacterium chitinilyticum TaxID=2485123 RepID=UPI003D098DE6